MTMSGCDRAARQLALIACAHRLLSDAAIPHWLAGGWGIDFLLGRVTRRHGDIDLAIWHHDWPPVEALLVANGFTPRANAFPEETGRLTMDGQAFEFYLLRRDAAGQVVVGGRWTDWPFPAGAFGDRTARLAGVTCPVMSAEGQLDSKERWPQHRWGSPLRAKDVADIARLRRHLRSGHHPADRAQLTPAEAEPALEEDDGDGERDGREEQLAEQRVRVQPAADRAGDEAGEQEQQGRGQAQPPGETLGGNPQHSDG
jgi:hypothetical protein